ncbi:TPA: YgiW/YdeI family stress tolerance OB fold protein [Vibrio vulnificus]
MKKILLVPFVLLASHSAFAAFDAQQQQGGFTGPKVGGVNTVANALTARDDTTVELTGNIVQSLGNEIYLFKDATGEIQVEIDHEDWRGQNVAPKDKVLIIGEVDSELVSTKIDVDSIQKL